MDFSFKAAFQDQVEIYTPSFHTEHVDNPKLKKKILTNICKNIIIVKEASGENMFRWTSTPLDAKMQFFSKENKIP